MKKSVRLISACTAAVLAVSISGIALMFNLGRQNVSAIDAGTAYTSQAFGTFINTKIPTGRNLIPFEESPSPWTTQYFDEGEWKNMPYGVREGGTQTIVSLKQAEPDVKPSKEEDGEMYAPGVRVSGSGTETRIAATAITPVASVFTAPENGTYSLGTGGVGYEDTKDSQARQTFKILINNKVVFSQVIEAANGSTSIANLSLVTADNFFGGSFQLKKGDKLRLAVYDDLGSEIANNKKRGINVRSEIIYVSDVYVEEANILNEKIEFNKYDSWDTTHPIVETGKDGLKTEFNDGFNTYTIGGSHDGAWIKFNNLYFGEAGAEKITVTYSGANNCADDARIEIREGDAEGTLFGVIEVPPTGAWSTWTTVTAKLDTIITDTKDICFVLRGTTEKTTGVTNKKYYVANLYNFSFDSANDAEIAGNVEALISEIGTVEFTPDCLAKITAAEAAYANLTAEQKDLVTNYDDLTAARYQYNLLEIGNADKTNPYEIVEFEKDFEGNNSGNSLKVESNATNNLTNVGGTTNGAWIKYTALDFGDEGASSINIKYAGNTGNCATDARVEIRLGSPTGTLAGTVNVPPVSNWDTYVTVSGDLDMTITGVHNVYMVFRGSNGSWIANFDYFQFNQSSNKEAADLVIAAIDAIGEVELNPVSLEKIEHAEELYSALSTTAKALVSNYNVLNEARREYDRLKIDAEGGRDPYSGTGINAASADRNSGFTLKSDTVSINGVMTNIVSGSYFNALLEIDSVSFGLEGAKSVSVTYSANSSLCPANATAEFYLDSVDGEKIATVKLSQTGNNWSIYNTVTADLSRVITGKHNIVIRLVGYTTQAQPQVANLANIKFATATSANLLDSSKVEETVRLINEIGLVMYDEESKALIDAARASYDALSSTQKTMVSNYRSLVMAEEMYSGLSEIQ